MRIRNESRFSFIAGAMTLLLLFVFCAGCGEKGKGASRGTLAVMFRSTTNSYYVEIEKGIRDAADASNVNVIVLASDQIEGVAQQELFSRILQIKAGALLIMPEAKPEADRNLIPLIKMANGQKLPVILMRTGIDEKKMEKEGAHVVTIIQCDNRKGGVLAGEYMAKKINGSGKVLLIRAREESYTGDERVLGFQEALMNNRNILIYDGPPCAHSRHKAFEECRKILKVNNDVKGIFAISDTMALGASDAAAFLKCSKPCIIGFGGTEEFCLAIKEGKADATITQSLYEIGKLAVESALNLWKGREVPPRLYSKTELITSETIGQPFKK